MPSTINYFNYNYHVSIKISMTNRFWIENSKEFLLSNEFSETNLNEYKKTLTWTPLMYWIYILSREYDHSLLRVSVPELARKFLGFLFRIESHADPRGWLYETIRDAHRSSNNLNQHRLGI